MRIARTYHVEKDERLGSPIYWNVIERHTILSDFNLKVFEHVIAMFPSEGAVEDRGKLRAEEFAKWRQESCDDANREQQEQA